MKIVRVTSNTITRPSDTTAYASGDLVANSTTAGSVTPFTLTIPYGNGLKIWRAVIAKSQASVTNANFKLHLFADSPTVANGDNGAISPTSSNYFGFITVDGTGGLLFSDTFNASGIFVNNSLAAPLVIVADTDRKVYGLLEARAAYSPASAETFTVSLIGEAYVQ